MNEINDSMSFKSEIIKSNGRAIFRNQKEEAKKTKLSLDGLFKKFFHLKISKSLPAVLSIKDKTKKEAKRERIAKKMFRKERSEVWDEICKKESKIFYKSDKLIKLKLSKIIPSEISHRRYNYIFYIYIYIICFTSSPLYYISNFNW